MIDPLLSLAYSMHANKGVYALLLGSGISRNAGIPTGWEVVLDLIRHLAKLKGEDPEPDPEQWYRTAFGDEPTYSEILDRVAKTPAERQQLLRGYFEPTEEEREQELKVPTAAHKAVADLVAKGYLRVIVTTNFDRLMEKALEAAGISPTVISTSDAIAGALPLIHTACTVIKANGDYLDTRIKNTPSELSSYDQPLSELLSRVADEFGLIICGWSGDYDDALSAIIMRSPSRRFTTYWTARGNVSEGAQRLIQQRGAEVITIESADAFFQDVRDKVFSLEDLARPHPLSARVAVATLKRYLPEERHRIRVHDLVTDETNSLLAELNDSRFPAGGEQPTLDILKDRMHQYEALVEPLQSLIITGCYWGGGEHEYLWQTCVERVFEYGGDERGHGGYSRLRKYPVLLLFYSGGIAALAAGKYGNLASLIARAKGSKFGEPKELPLALLLTQEDVISKKLGQWVHNPGEVNFTPVNDYLHQILREPLREVIPRDAHYTNCFDRFEYLWVMSYLDLQRQFKHTRRWVIGGFLWRDQKQYDSQETVLDQLFNEMEAASDAWAGLKAGLFGGTLQRLLDSKKEFTEALPRLRNSLDIW